ncbi:nicotinate-nucleotide adenylyltransferase [Alkaliphilus hydrothermalis]|uniref:Probable nicotinate-nucleotide adenylyltransferase n=1 Tax=Alkaliphilus hydrothermalis TaxID=1482730 RepID=A0ABS2NSK0_9FIRM|nr:nicotinate-nucleotide adenylyltransferase [Alkaliphilus hydrothermalis]MBM7615816.1 nicotinate-nucleotide adenylyltransferase [Alkaliphilus hydrothermalis]
MKILKKGEVSQIKRIGILGGTFDPIHNGHLFIAEMALEDLQLDEVVFIPNRRSPHKLGVQVTEAYHRLIMTEIATIDNGKFTVTPMEIQREGPSYTIDTIHQLHKEFPENASFYFITGSDVLMDIQLWRGYRELFQLIKFAVVTRGGFNNTELEDKILYLKNQYGAEILKIKIPNLEISSTDIRKRTNEGKSIKYLVPEGIGAYIRKHGLYLSQEE